MGPPEKLLDVLHLLPHLLDQHLELQRGLRDLDVHRLGRQCIGFAVQLLGAEARRVAEGGGI